MKVVGYGALSALTAAFFWALAERFREGLIVTNMTQFVPWGLWISLYIFFIGLSAGSFLLSTLVYVFGVRRFEAVGPLALLQALLCLVLGMFLIWVDLGHPARFFNVFAYFNPVSVLAWESVFYVAYAFILLAELRLALRPALARVAEAGGRGSLAARVLGWGGGPVDSAWKDRAARRLKALGILGIPIAIGVHGGTGAIFAVVKSRPMWYTGLFPIIFLVSALASGGALLALVTAVLSRLAPERKLDVVRGLMRITIGIVAFDLLLVASELLVVFYGGMPHHATGWREVLFGPMWWVFWIVQLLLGSLIPILLVAGRRTGRSIGWLGAAGAAVVVGIVGVRLNVVIPALIEPEFAGLPAAYHHVRFGLGYLPSAVEWLVGLGAFAIGAWLVLLAKRVLPLEEAA